MVYDEQQSTKFIHNKVECPVVRDPEGSSDPRREPVEGQYYFYILECKDSSLYCGSSNNLSTRLHTHNIGKAAEWTAIRRPLQLVYYESYYTLVGARKREQQVKG